MQAQEKSRDHTGLPLGLLRLDLLARGLPIPPLAGNRRCRHPRAEMAGRLHVDHDMTADELEQHLGSEKGSAPPKL